MNIISPAGSVTCAVKFPNPWIFETMEDVIAVGGALSAQNLKKSYELGIFPWPHEGYPLLWFCPEMRGVIEFSEMKIGRSLKKWIKKNENLIRVEVNQNFVEVIKNCQRQKRRGQKGSWITPEIIKSYTELHQTGGALSVECYMEEKLISGIYGVLSNHYFSCESMFYKIDNGSKYAFYKLVEYLKALGHLWMDLQMITEVSESFGGKYITKEEFLKKIKCPLN